MLTVNEQRMQKIRQKCRQYRRQYENRRLGELACSCVFLVLCIFSVLKEAGVSGSSAVTGAYSSVVLHNGGGIFVFIGIAAFAAGVTITVLCIRYRRYKKSSHKKWEDQ